MAMALVVTAVGVFAAWSALHRPPAPSPRPAAAMPGKPVVLRITWGNGLSMRAGIPDGGAGRLKVGVRLLQFGAKRMDGTVKLQVSEVRPASQQGGGESVSFLGQFELRPGAAATVQEPSPFTVEWIAPGEEPAR